MAWHRHTGDGPLRPEVLHHREYHSEATPLKVGDTLYTCTPHRWAVASEATTGRLIGKYLHQVQVRQQELAALEAELEGLISRSRELDPADCTDQQICHIIAPHD